MVHQHDYDSITERNERVNEIKEYVIFPKLLAWMFHIRCCSQNMIRVISEY